jgi:hypothetical protein
MTRRRIPDTNEAQLENRPDPQPLVIKPEPIPVSAGTGQKDPAATDAWTGRTLIFAPGHGLVDHGVVVGEELHKLMPPSSAAGRRPGAGVANESQQESGKGGKEHRDINPTRFLWTEAGNCYDLTNQKAAEFPPRAAAHGKFVNSVAADQPWAGKEPQNPLNVEREEGPCR